ncbi:hypothetical protein Bca4012_022021 [Brassica carinata]
MDDHQFAWILWYLLKAQNNKIFSDLDVDSRDTLKFAETESRVWAEALETIAQTVTQSRDLENVVLPNIPGHWCFTDGSWKDKDLFTGHAWYSNLEGFDGLMGARNVRATLTPLHAEIEVLLWAMECIRNLHQFHVTFATDCSQLVKMVSELEEWPTFANYLEDIKILRGNFNHSEIIHIPRTQNLKADSLAHSAGKQSFFVVHMDAELPVWFAESV